MDATCSLEMFAKQYVTYIMESTATKLKKEMAIEKEDVGDTVFSAMKSLCGRITPTEMRETSNEHLKTANELKRHFEAGDSLSGDPSKFDSQENEAHMQLKFDEDLDVSIDCFIQTVIDTAKEQVKLEMAKKQVTENSCESTTVLGRNEQDDTTADEEERIKFFGVFRNNEFEKLKEATHRQKKCGNGLTEEDVAYFMQVDLKGRYKTQRSINEKEIHGRKANHQADNDVEKVFSGTDVQYLHRTKTSETEYYHFYKELPNDCVNESYQHEIKEKGHQHHRKKHNNRSAKQKKEVVKENKHTDKQKREVVNENRESDDQKKDHSPNENRRSHSQKKGSLLRRIMNTIFGIQKKKEQKDKRTNICTGSMADSLDHLSSILGKGDNQTDITESLSELQQDMTEDELDFNCDDIEDPPRPTLKPFFKKQQADVIISRPESEVEPGSERKEKRKFRALTCCFRC